MGFSQAHVPVLSRTRMGWNVVVCALRRWRGDFVTLPWFWEMKAVLLSWVSKSLLDGAPNFSSCCYHKAKMHTRKLSESLDLSSSPERAEWVQLVLSLCWSVTKPWPTLGQHCRTTSSYFDVGPKAIAATSVSALDTRRRIRECPHKNSKNLISYCCF